MTFEEKRDMFEVENVQKNVLEKSPFGICAICNKVVNKDDFAKVKLIKICKSCNKKYDIKIEEKINTQELDNFFDKVLKHIPSKKGRGKVSSTQKKKLYKIGLDNIIQAINNYKKDPQLKVNSGFKEYMHGSTFLNSGYLDYLPEKSKGDKVEPLELKFDESEI